MQRYLPITKQKLIQAAAGAINYLKHFRAGVYIGAVMRFVEAHRMGAGLAVEQAPFDAKVSNDIGVVFARTYGSVAHQGYAQSGSQSAGGDWENPANVAGEPDNGFATLAEGLLLVQGTLIARFAQQQNREHLTIDRVRIRFYFQVAEFLLAGSTLQLQYRIGDLGVPQTLATFSGGIIDVTNVDHLQDGLEFDITDQGSDGLGAAWTPQALSDIQALFNGTILVDTGLSVVRANAARLDIDYTAPEQPV